MNANIDEKEWVIDMRSILNNDLENYVENPVCIFQVPKSIRNAKPEAYTPQVVALGPYHHFRPKTYYMQRCKLSTALQARQELKLRVRKIQQMVNAIMDKLPDIRSSYHDNLGVQKDTLAWMMLIDGLLLLSLIYNRKNNRPTEETDDKLGNDQLKNLSESQHVSEANSEDDHGLLENPNPIIEGAALSVPINDWLQGDYPQEEENGRRQISNVSEKTDQFVDSRGRKHPLDVILKDVVLLENQIPKIVFDALLDEDNEGVLFVETEDDEGELLDETEDDEGELLDETEDNEEELLDENEVDEGDLLNETEDDEEDLWHNLTDFCTGLSPIKLQGNTTHHKMDDPHHVLDFLYQLVWLGKVTISPMIVTVMDTYIKDSDVKTWTNLYSQLSNLNFSFVSVILAMVDLILKILDALGISLPRDIFSEKEVLIPSASQLSDVGVKFCRVGKDDGGIKDIAFKHKTDSSKKDKTDSVTLSLPVLSANVNSDLSEVVMRNLLAYEAEAMPESPKFSRYIELMSALMQTTTDFHVVPEDANSAEIVKLFSSLKEAVGSKGKSELDDTIKEVNGFYDSCRKVKIRRLVKR